MSHLRLIRSISFEPTIRSITHSHTYSIYKPVNLWNLIRLKRSKKKKYIEIFSVDLITIHFSFNEFFFFGLRNVWFFTPQNHKSLALLPAIVTHPKYDQINFILLGIHRFFFLFFLYSALWLFQWSLPENIIWWTISSIDSSDFEHKRCYNMILIITWNHKYFHLSRKNLNLFHFISIVKESRVIFSRLNWSISKWEKHSSWLIIVHKWRETT